MTLASPPPVTRIGWGTRAAVLFAATCALGLLAVAGMHRLQLGSSSYVRGPLVSVEVGGMFLVLLCLPMLGILALIELLRRRWRAVGLCLLGILLCILAWVGALFVDAPTLIYAT